MAEFEVEFYETTDGDKPAKDFLISLDNKMRAKMASMISLLQENGYNLREPYSKHLSEGIFELRAKVGSDITRVMYFFLHWSTCYLNERICKEDKKDSFKRIRES